MSISLCAVVGKPLHNADLCPLPQGSCMYQHDRDRSCVCCDEDLSVEEFALRTGRKVPIDAEVKAFKATLLASLRKL